MHILIAILGAAAAAFWAFTYFVGAVAGSAAQRHGKRVNFKRGFAVQITG